MRHCWKRAMAIWLVLAMVATLCFSCGGKAEVNTVITIGEMTDLSGPASPALYTLNYALKDVVSYYNEEGLIPGVTLKVVTWDTKYDPSRAKPGYDWIRGQGAKLIINVDPPTGVVLKSFADRDKVPVFSLSVVQAMLEPPGWVFSPSNTPSAGMKTLLKWLSENRWDYNTKGIPTVGCVGWSEPVTVGLAETMQEYCQAHPGQFQWAGGFVAPMGTLMWGGEVEKLKNCSFIAVPGYPMGEFIKVFQGRGYSTTFIDAGVAIAYVTFLVDQCGWPALDGLLSTCVSLYWNEPAHMVDTAKELLRRYRPKQAQEIMDAGVSYVGGFHNLIAAFQILQQAIEQVGAKNLDAQAVYDAAVKYKTAGPMWVGIPEWAFSETKRYLGDHVAVYEFNAKAKDVIRITDWLSLVEK